MADGTANHQSNYFPLNTRVLAILRRSAYSEVTMDITPIRGFFLIMGFMGLVLYALGGCKHFVGAMNAFAGEYNDVYTGMNDPEEEDGEEINKDK